MWSFASCFVRLWFHGIQIVESTNVGFHCEALDVARDVLSVEGRKRAVVHFQLANSKLQIFKEGPFLWKSLWVSWIIVWSWVIFPLPLHWWQGGHIVLRLGMT